MEAVARCLCSWCDLDFQEANGAQLGIGNSEKKGV